MTIKKIIRGTLFFTLGIGMFWYVYRDLDLSVLEETLYELKYEWIFASFFFGLLSHYIRALRWKMLIESLGHKPRSLNLFLSVLVLYFVNLIIPRGGEFARCGTVSRYEKIPFMRLFGTVFVERITDIFAFLVIFLGVIIWKFELVKTLIGSLNFDLSGYHTKIMLVGVGGLVMVLFYFVSRRFGLLDRFHHKIKTVKANIKNGLQSILLIRNVWLYLAHTAVIFIAWLLMLYVIFFAYAPTSNMTFGAAIFAYTVGTLAYFLPIQAGIGVWHFLIIQSLFFFGLEKEAGMMYALIAHTFTNLVYLIFGGVGFLVLPFVNQKEMHLVKTYK